jgi:hypothetical protein
MPEVTLQIDEQIRTLVLGIATEASMDLERNLPAADSLADDDPELSEAWLGDLRAQQEDEAGQLLALLSDAQFGQTRIPLSEDAAEAILRAAADLRLRIRADHLAEIPDARLEAGDLPLQNLPPKQQHAVFAYWVLAALQEQLIEGLDPDAI